MQRHDGAKVHSINDSDRNHQNGSANTSNETMPLMGGFRSTPALPDYQAIKPEPSVSEPANLKAHMTAQFHQEAAQLKQQEQHAKNTAAATSTDTMTSKERKRLARSQHASSLSLPATAAAAAAVDTMTLEERRKHVLPRPLSAPPTPIQTPQDTDSSGAYSSDSDTDPLLSTTTTPQTQNGTSPPSAFANGRKQKRSKRRSAPDTRLDESSASAPTTTTFWQQYFLWLLRLIIAVSAALGTSVNALVMPTNGAPKDILKGSFWEKMGVWLSGLSVTLAAASLYVNVPLNMYFMEHIGERLKTFSNRRSAINILSIFFGGAAAVAATAITYDGLGGFSSQAVILYFSVVSFIISFAGRTLGFSKLLDSLYSMGEDFFALFTNRIQPSPQRIQEQAVYLWTHLKPEFRHLLKFDEVKRAQLDKANKKGRPHLNNDDYEDILQAITEKLCTIHAENIDCFNQPSASQRFGKYGLILLNSSYALLIAVIAYITFSDKAWHGEEIFVENSSARLPMTSIDLSETPNWLKQLLSIPGAAASAGLYLVCAAQLARSFDQAVQHLRQIPDPAERKTHIAQFTAQFAVTILSAAAMVDVGMNIPNRGPNNLYEFIPKSFLTQFLFAAADGLGAFGVNVTPLLKDYRGAPDPLNPTELQILEHFSNPYMQLISQKAVIAAMRQLHLIAGTSRPLPGSAPSIATAAAGATGLTGTAAAAAAAGITTFTTTTPSRSPARTDSTDSLSDASPDRDPSATFAGPLR